jgi:outer membrane murein-binding lipoprotein Lpp
LNKIGKLMMLLKKLLSISIIALLTACASSDGLEKQVASLSQQVNKLTTEVSKLKNQQDKANTAMDELKSSNETANNTINQRIDNMAASFKK